VKSILDIIAATAKILAGLVGLKPGPKVPEKAKRPE
jgi:hypothetical protein